MARYRISEKQTLETVALAPADFDALLKTPPLGVVGMPVYHRGDDESILWPAESDWAAQCRV